MQSAAGSAPRGEGQGRASVSVRPGLCLRKPVRTMSEAAAGGTAAPASAAFSHTGHSPSADCPVGPGSCHPSPRQTRGLSASESWVVLGLQLWLGACCSGGDWWPAAKGHVLGD